MDVIRNLGYELPSYDEDEGESDDAGVPGYYQRNKGWLEVDVCATQKRWLGDSSGGDDTCDETAEYLLWTARAGYSIAILLWVLGSTVLLYKFVAPPRLVAQGQAFQTILLDGGWLAFWVAKDLAWSWEEEYWLVALLCWVIHFLLLCFAFMVS